MREENAMKLNGGSGVVLVMGGVFLAFSSSQQRPMKQFLNPDAVPKPTGYTQVVSSRQGRMIFISGQGGASADGQMPADFASQASNTFENIGRCLAAAGARFEDVVKMNYYLTDLSNTVELRRIRAKYLNQSAPPASTLVQAGLIGKDLLLEVEVVAIVPQ
jgi:2-iminobutanoate/2-iminopropanoate deaminase